MRTQAFTQIQEVVFDRRIHVQSISIQSRPRHISIQSHPRRTYQYKVLQGVSRISTITYEPIYEIQVKAVALECRRTTYKDYRTSCPLDRKSRSGAPHFASLLIQLTCVPVSPPREPTAHSSCRRAGGTVGPPPPVAATVCTCLKRRHSILRRLSGENVEGGELASA